MFALFRKELADHLDSLRFLIVFAMALLLAGVSLYSALGGLRDAIDSFDGSSFVFLRLFVVGNGSIPSFASFIMLVGPLFGLILGFDAINGEKNAGTLNRLLAQPIHRDAVINGKFLAGVVVISIIILSMALMVAGVGLLRTGIPPNGEEVFRLMVFLFFAIVYVSFWMGLAILFSVLTRHVATSVLSVVGVWLIFAIFFGLIVQGLTTAIYPPVSEEMLVRAVDFQQQFMRISPSQLFTEATGTILDPTRNTLSYLSLIEHYYSGGVTGMLPLGQSLLLVWPHLIGLLALTLASFVASYIVFMKQEIRGA
jgi:ABC-2 type transport system permease protein